MTIALTLLKRVLRLALTLRKWLQGWKIVGFIKRPSLLKKGATTVHKEGSRGAAFLDQELVNGLHECLYLERFFESNEVVVR